MKMSTLRPVVCLLFSVSLAAAGCGDDTGGAGGSGGSDGSGGAGGAGATTSTTTTSTADTTTTTTGGGDVVSAEEIAQYCEYLVNCWDDAEPCEDSVGLDEAPCQAEGRALADCVIDGGEVLTVCEGDEVPCIEQFDAFYGCREGG